MIHRSKLLLVLTLLAFSIPAAKPADQYAAQDSWERFSEKEETGGFKLSKPKVAPKSDSMLAPVLRQKPHEDPGKSYVLMPAADPPSQVPSVHVETTMVPTVQQNAPAMAPGFGGFGFGGWGGGRWGSGWGGGFGPGWGGGFGRYGGWGGGFGAPFGYSPSTVMYHPEKKIVQEGPSKPSGNYYSPSTPDPTASGNYYASPSGLPKAAPIIHQDGAPKDYWGDSGNPLPGNMRSDR